MNAAKTLSRRKHGFDSRRARQTNQWLSKIADRHAQLIFNIEGGPQYIYTVLFRTTGTQCPAGTINSSWQKGGSYFHEEGCSIDGRGAGSS